MGAIKKDTKIPLHFVQQEGDPEMRQISLQIEREPEDYGMRGPSLFFRKGSRIRHHIWLFDRIFS